MSGWSRKGGVSTTGAKRKKGGKKTPERVRWSKTRERQGRRVELRFRSKRKKNELGHNWRNQTKKEKRSTNQAFGGNEVTIRVREVDASVRTTREQQKRRSKKK